jgi:hypothetical protein
MNPGTLPKHQHLKRRDESLSFDLADSHFDGNPNLSNPLNSLASDMRSRIMTPHDDSPKSGRDDRISTRRRFAKMTAGFQRHEQVCATSRLASQTNGVDLRMSFPELLMVTFSDQVSFGIDDHSTDHGIGLHKAETCPRNPDRSLHYVNISGEHKNSSRRLSFGTHWRIWFKPCLFHGKPQASVFVLSSPRSMRLRKSQSPAACSKTKRTKLSQNITRHY